jgi:DNA repair exonuclease SbcCD ATPase subunit
VSIYLDSLTVRSFRGIRDEEEFSFNGRNKIILGPNGSGKSTVLQAVEFLLTGEVSALRGSGTSGISAKRHIPNQYANSDETAVEATLGTTDGESFRVVREFSDRSRLQAESRPQALQELTTAAEQGLIHLSRDELLELVISTPGNRKEQIYQLMNTEGIDSRRRQLKRLARNAQQEETNLSNRFQEQLQQLRQIAGADIIVNDEDASEICTETLLETVNVRRERLDGSKINSITTENSFQHGIESPIEQASNPLQNDRVNKQLTAIETWVNETAADTAETLATLREELRTLRANEDALKDLAEKELITQGLQSIDETTSACPLCKEPWEQSDLEEHLNKRADRLDKIDARSAQIEQLVTDARGEIKPIRRTIDRVSEALSDEGLEVDITPLIEYRDALTTVIEALSEELATKPHAAEIETLALPTETRDKVTRIVASLKETADSLPNQSEIQKTWDELQTLNDLYREAKRIKIKQQQYERVTTELEAAHSIFLESRDDVLGQTFELVNERFATFYEAINPDESNFNPNIAQTDTGVSFEVDFHNMGEHPPHAMHSEGHQDLMGVCLFFALASELSPLQNQPVLLDDIVMSVDEGHRSQFATMLRNELSEYFQLIMTTHDSSWAGQLVENGVADESDIIRFSDWTPEQGPTVTSGF